MKKNGQHRYKCLVLGRDRSYFVKKHSDSSKEFSETDIINMLEPSIFIIFGGRVFQRTVGIPMGTNCALLLADQLLYSYETDFIQGFLKKNEKKLERSFNFTFRYIDDLLSLNNSRFGDFVDRIYPIELEIKDTTDTDRFASYLYLHLEIGSEGRLRTKRQKRRFPFSHCELSIHMQHYSSSTCVWGIYLSVDTIFQSLWFLSSYQDFLDRGLLLTRKLLNQGFLLVKLKSSLRKFYGRHHDLVVRYGISVPYITTDIFHLSQTLPGPFLVHDLSPGL